MGTEKTIRLGLVATPGIGPKTARKARDATGGWEAAVRAARGKHSAIPVRLRRGFAEAEARGRRVAQACVRVGVRTLFRGDPEWPEALECLSDVPEALFVRGRVDALKERGVAVVGTRECSMRGADLTRRMAARLAESGWCVVSGLARGIDTAAHNGALAAGGDTVAVLGCGPDVAYPPENRDLAERIASEGALLSEFPPGVEPRPGHFPRRNRVLSALAHAVLVVESRARGGALVTVRHALDQGKEVFVVPGWPDSPYSAGPLELLRAGARAVRSPEDLIEDLGGTWGGPSLDAGETEALDVLRTGVRTADDLAAALGIPPREAQDRLARLELQGLVVPGGSPHG